VDSLQRKAGLPSVTIVMVTLMVRLFFAGLRSNGARIDKVPYRCDTNFRCNPDVRPGAWNGIAFGDFAWLPLTHLRDFY